MGTEAPRQNMRALLLGLLLAGASALPAAAAQDPVAPCDERYDRESCDIYYLCTWCVDASDPNKDACFDKKQEPSGSMKCDSQARPARCGGELHDANNGTDPCKGHRCDTAPCP